MVALVFTGLIALGAQVELDFGPVPFILSDFFVLLAGLLLSIRWALLSTVLYLIIGGFGLPVFAAGGSGWLHLFGPTGGYLFGFVLASGVMGAWGQSRSFSWPILAGVTFTGQVCFFLLGVSWLALMLDLNLWEALEAGMFPFWLAMILKCLSASGIAWAVRKQWHIFPL